MNDDERHVLLTGGLGDIARAIATQLGRSGYRVMLVDQAPDDVGQTRVAELDAATGTDGRFTYLRADVRRAEELQRAVDAMPRVDVAIANAGIGRSGPILELDLVEWQAHLDVNLTGSMLTGQLAARRMAAQGTGGLLVFISSWIGSVPWPEMTAYVASKAGVEMLSKQFARELAPLGIRSNVVAPGIVLAGMAKEQLENEPQYAARTAKVVPLRRLQTPESVASAVAFLCSDGADYMTGSKITVDGGGSLFAFD